MKRVLIALAALAPALAFAHPGAEAHGLSAGFSHPLLGWDHLLAMVGVGMLAVAGQDRPAWQLPLAFVGFMLVGALLGLSGLAIGGLEGGIMLSLVVTGLMLSIGRAPRLLMAAGLCGLFGLLHGNAHGLELPASASAPGYFAGFVLATGLLHGTGWLAAGRWHASLVRIAGVGMTGAGILAAI
ncbi:HupE/UreJ family protein [Zobellella maritima]|uniref:HupE/UreJ family protein n=1 Tax=Zobellella maritima TaxID=2059725 RepID=UPI000E3072B3|nr:HupE/UreJ family protein [Zobellella maritima]